MKLIITIFLTLSFLSFANTSKGIDSRLAFIDTCVDHIEDTLSLFAKTNGMKLTTSADVIKGHTKLKSSGDIYELKTKVVLGQEVPNIYWNYERTLNHTYKVNASFAEYDGTKGNTSCYITSINKKIK